jgi:hypothetical protein
VKKTLRTLWKSKKTTLTGVATLALTGWQIYANPATAANPATIGQIVTGVGLLLADDAKADAKADAAQGNGR